LFGLLTPEAHFLQSDENAPSGSWGNKKGGMNIPPFLRPAAHYFFGPALIAISSALTPG
jgi:hypothetical protein